MQSKDDGKYLRFQRDSKHNLYYMDISEAEFDEHCYLNTVKERLHFPYSTKKELKPGVPLNPRLFYIKSKILYLP